MSNDPMPAQPALMGMRTERFPRWTPGSRRVLDRCVIVLGRPGCPPCEEAYRTLAAAFPGRVEFARPAGDRNSYMRVFPRPVATAGSTLRYTAPVAVVPTIVVTDQNGQVVWQHVSWPPTNGEAQAIVQQVERLLGRRGER